MKVGPYEVRTLSTGQFALDGGAMFGNVPRALWARHHEPDKRHRIPLELRVVYAEGDGRRILVDTGAGNLWSEKEERIFDVQGTPEPGLVTALKKSGIDPASITDVVLTHLHFDHAGGVTKRSADGRPELTFPAARHHVQAENLKTAQNPNQRERASYLERHWRPLLEDADLKLTSGDQEVLPGVFAHVSDGHTTGLQVIRFGAGPGALVFTADMIPLATHVQIPWTMGYDLCVRTLMEEKQKLLDRAVKDEWVILLEHDPGTSAVRVLKEGDRFKAGESLSI